MSFIGCVLREDINDFVLVNNFDYIFAIVFTLQIT